MSALALAWVLHQPGVTAAIIGPRRPEHVDAALEAARITLPHEDLGRMGRLFAS